MGYGFTVQMEGEWALFSRPELKVERYSYDVITPSAARGILEAVCWKPAIRYVIDKIHVINPIRTMNIRRNEVTEKISARAMKAAMGNGRDLSLSSTANIAQRASLLLRDVCYVVEAHFVMTSAAGETDSPEKFYSMIRRRLLGGQCYHQPYMGCREFPARLSLLEGEIPPSAYAGEVRDLGLMLYDMNYEDAQNIQPTYFRAVLQDGVLDLEDCEVIQ